MREHFFTPRLRVKSLEELNVWLLDKCIAYLTSTLIAIVKRHYQDSRKRSQESVCGLTHRPRRLFGFLQATRSTT